ncbi:hypothetical protein GPEL0_01r2508 [Geoanaerobacter pelophilus]|uniref:Uncharacterized protein n=1 Tax=Geoanaerobacter pelophilus TaxID=60036 RepID=A0ABQ0MIM6_9BACT|nr:hypothetical protein GPEL0_01r2508 [Geoanaerobacter pelophilus]
MVRVSLIKYRLGAGELYRENEIYFTKKREKMGGCGVRV